MGAELGKATVRRSAALDVRLDFSYLPTMATRLLLTLLALLTGLAAQLSPAQARICAGVDTEIGEVASSQAVPRRSTAVALNGPPLQTHALRGHAVTTFAIVMLAAVTPAVLQGIDRARE
jgi:hypothetical protein